MEIARVRFQSSRNPQESGAVTLSSDGTVQIEPSDAFVEAIASLEQGAVETATRTGAAAAVVLIGLGLIAAAAGWYAGRVGGKLRQRITEPMDSSEVSVRYVADKAFQITHRGRRTVPMILKWAAGEYNADEAEQFEDEFERIRKAAAS